MSRQRKPASKRPRAKEAREMLRLALVEEDLAKLRELRRHYLDASESWVVRWSIKSYADWLVERRKRKRLPAPPDQPWEEFGDRERWMQKGYLMFRGDFENIETLMRLTGYRAQAQAVRAAIDWKFRRVKDEE
ncbi:MAG TPA: hypothetical protein VGN42_25980 [Pirellulales bacterium]|jgi:hypothetical protein|nr:hypothetical protein [Pirellulales bacterium]